jgi:hypothetical protein
MFQWGYKTTSPSMLVRGEKTKIITLERLLFMAFQRNTITSLSPLQRKKIRYTLFFFLNQSIMFICFRNLGAINVLLFMLNLFSTSPYCIHNILLHILALPLCSYDLKSCMIMASTAGGAGKAGRKSRRERWRNEVTRPTSSQTRGCLPVIFLSQIFRQHGVWERKKSPRTYII